MFKPELKDTGWEDAPEVVFHISGENYKESRFIGYTTEIEVLNTLNNSLIEVVWDTTSEQELETFLDRVLERMEIDLIGLRIEFDPEAGYVFGWVHYKEEKKTKTLRFKISLRGELSVC
jgi:hypothetical protein